MQHQDSPDPARDRDLLAGAWVELEQGLAGDRGPLGALRRAPRSVRLGACLGAALLVPAAMALALPRGDLADVSVLRAASLFTSVLVIAALGALVVTRPLQLPALASRRVVAFGVVAVGSLLALCTMPLAVDRHDLGPPPHGALVCGATSLLAALTVVALAHAARRGARAETVGAAALGAASAFASMALVCPIDEVVHLWLGHGAPLAGLVALVALHFAWPTLRRV